MSRGPVEFDHPAAGWTEDAVGLKPFAIGQIANQDSFVGPQADPFCQVTGNGQASLVVDRGSSNAGAMNL